MTRIEHDFLGDVGVPDEAYYGVFTVRAKANFQLTGMKARPSFIHALGQVKRAAAQVHKQLKLMPPEKVDAIEKAAHEVANGQHDDQFPLDVLQAGAGTPFNMNANEVIANRALELMGKARGTYTFIHPNNDVNKSQSSNDVVPTAIRLALLSEHGRIIESITSLRASLSAKGKHYAHVIQTGRTHLQDAVPISIEQVFEAYARDFELDSHELEAAAHRLCELGIGGTAIGTCINTHPKFREKMVKQLAKNTGLALRAGPSPVELTSNMNAFLSYAHALSHLAVSLERMSKDFQLLASGPRGGIGEFRLPEVEPGSSIMPGKINPSIAEAAQMASAQALAHVSAIESACRGGQLQLNMMTPLIARNSLDAQDLLTRTLDMMRTSCVDGLVVDGVRADHHLMEGLIVATALAPQFGYTQVSEWIKEADKRRIGIREVILEKGVLSKNELDAALDPKKMLGPKE